MSNMRDLCNMPRLFILELLASLLLPVAFMHQIFNPWDVAGTATSFPCCMLMVTFVSILSLNERSWESSSNSQIPKNWLAIIVLYVLNGEIKTGHQVLMQ